MSILTRVLIVFTFLLSVVFVGYHMALYSARTNHKAQVENINQALQDSVRKHKSESEISKVALRNLEAEIARLRTMNKGVIDNEANFQVRLSEKDSEIRRLKSLNDKASENLTNAQTSVALLTSERDAVRQEAVAWEQKAKGATELTNLLIDLAHTEEQQKILYREQVKKMKIDLDNQQYELQLTNNRLREYMEQFGSLKRGIVPRIDGQVVGVGPDGETIVINQGKENGVQKGYEFAITRGNKFIGKATVEEVDKKLSVLYINHAFDQFDQFGRVIPVLKHDNISTKK